MDETARADVTSGDDRIWVLLDRYLTGESTSDEAHAVRAWLAADPAHRELLDTTRRIREIAGDPPPVRSVDAVWKRAVDELGLGPDALRVIALLPSSFPERPRFTALPPRPQRRIVSLMLASAAVLVLVVGGRMVWNARPDARPSGGWSGASTQYVTQRGQRLSFRLADGTLVVLAPGSTLEKPAGYGIRERVLRLEGEAYFEVTHDLAKPFSVYTAGAIARDLGTRFVVRAYSTDSATDVIVTQGTVVLEAGKSAVLAAGQRGHAGRDGHVTVRFEADLDPYVAWTEGRLAFRDTPLRDVAQRLARWYDVNIDFNDATVGALRLTASFDDQPVTDLLDKIADPLGLVVTRQGRRYTISARS